MRKLKQKRGTKDFEFPTIGVREGVGSGARTVKMVEPRCNICQPIYNHPLWWKLCPEDHDKYFTHSEVEVPKRQVEVGEDGVRRIIGSTTELVDKRELNVTQIPMTARVNSGKSMEDAVYHGCVTMEELGYKHTCEYQNCFAQPDELIITPYGTFCSVSQAQLVGADEEEVVLEVHDQKKRKAQLNSINLDMA